MTVCEPKRREDRLTALQTGKGRENLVYFGAPWVIAVLVGILYLNSLGNQFTNWDDGMIYSNPGIRSLVWENLVKLFTPVRGETYQPVRILSYAIDYHFWVLNPLGYRITNILFYMLTCLVAFFTIRLLSMHLRPESSPDSHERVALFGSLLFTAHPIHVEAVTWLAARKEVLQGFFFFLAFYLYLRARAEEGKKRKAFLGIVLFSFLLAILSKPSAVIFPGVILIYEIARGKESIGPFVKRHWLFLLLSIAVSSLFTFILIRVMVEAGGIKPYYGDSFIKNFLVCQYVFLRSIKLLCLSLQYAAAYSFSIPLPVFSLRNVSMFFLTLFLFGASALSLRWTRVFFFSFFFFLVSLFPFLNILPISTLLADRYLFIASFSFAFLLGAAFDRFYMLRLKRFSKGFFKLLSASIFTFLLAGYSLLTIHQNTIWHDSFSLWTDAVEKSPESNTANAMAGVVYSELRKDEVAVKYLEKAVQIIPQDYLSRNNLGIVYGRLGEPEKALNEFKTAIQLRPDDDTLKINLAVLCLQEKEFDQAEAILKSLLAKNPRNTNLIFRLFLVYKERGDYWSAVSELEKLIQINPALPNAYLELGSIYLVQFKDRTRAKYYITKGIETLPKGSPKGEEIRWMIQDLENL
jgi:protein O-mannosyl-transferase